MNKELNNDIKQVIIGLASSFENDARTANTETINKLRESFNDNEELYETEMILAFMHFSNFAAMPWLEKHPNIVKNKDIISCIYNGLFGHFIRRIIETKEGSPFSGDKENFIIRQVKEAIATNQNLSLQMTYGESKHRDKFDKSKWNDRAYWSPESFEDTDDVINKFMEWYRISDADYQAYNHLYTVIFDEGSYRITVSAKNENEAEEKAKDYMERHEISYKIVRVDISDNDIVVS